MGHITSKAYFDPQKRLDDSVQGAPESETLYKILEILFTEKEAELVSKLPLNVFNAKKASKIWKISVNEASKILDQLSDKGILLDIRKKNDAVYLLAPTMAGFFEFSLMRTDGKFDRKILSELFYNYVTSEGKFMGQIFRLDPPIARVIVHEQSISAQTVVLDYERASHIINTASCISVGTCYCRHKMEHLGKACKNPQDVCLTFNNSAKSLTKHGIAKEISKEEAKKILDKCVNLGLAQIGDNVREGVNWICNCCGCCCEAILAFKHFGYGPYLTSNMIAEYSGECVACGICAKKCPVGAITFHKGNKKDKLFENSITIDENKCIGCGVCVRFCATKKISMKRMNKNTVPIDGVERVVLEAINEGKLQNYLFDNYNSLNQATLRRFTAVMLGLKPVDRKRANKQLKSRFFKALYRTGGGLKRLMK